MGSNSQVRHHTLGLEMHALGDLDRFVITVVGHELYCFALLPEPLHGLLSVDRRDGKRLLNGICLLNNVPYSVPTLFLTGV